MSSLLDQEVLKVNAYWVPIGIVTVRKAFEDAAAGSGLLCQHEHGWFTLFALDEWLGLPLSEDEPYIGHGHVRDVQRVKIPRVMMAVNFKRYETKEQKCTPENLLKRYGHKDAVTGQPLRRERFSREHVHPKSKGGRSGWRNEVPMDRDLNSRRGNKSYSSIGLNPPKILPAPRPLLPVNTLVNRHGYPEWDHFHIPRLTDPQP